VSRSSDAVRWDRSSRRTWHSSTTSRCGHTTWTPLTSDAINRGGLRLSASATRRTAAATSDAASFRRATLASSRSRACTPSAAMRRRRRAFEDGAVRSVQNGIGNEELVAARASRHPRHDLPRRAVIAPGHVGRGTAGGHRIGPFEPEPRAAGPRSRRLADALNRSGPVCGDAGPRGCARRTVDDGDLHTRPPNPVGARSPAWPTAEIGDLRADAGAWNSGLIDECARPVAGAHGIELDPRSREDMVEPTPPRRRPRPRSLDDPGRLARTARAEIDCLTAAIVERWGRARRPRPSHPQRIWALSESIGGLVGMSAEIEGRYRSRPRERILARDDVGRARRLRPASTPGFDGVSHVLCRDFTSSTGTRTCSPVPLEGDPAIVFPSEVNGNVGLPRWRPGVDERVFVDYGPGACCPRPVRGRLLRGASTGSNYVMNVRD
jgi:hypothetical protein